jgi:hypothetical protein
MTPLEQLLTKFVDKVSQYSHVSFGAGFVMLFTMFHISHLLWYGVPLYVCFFAWKEFIYDEAYEIPEIRGSGWRDFGFEILGTLVGLIFTYLFFKIK